MGLRTIVSTTGLVLVAAGLGACSPAKRAEDAAADDVVSKAVVRVDGKVFLLATLEVGVSMGKGSHRGFWRLDRIDLSTGTRDGFRLWPHNSGIGAPRCCGGPGPTGLWCQEGKGRELVVRDAMSLEAVDDTAALAAKVPALGNGIARVDCLVESDAVLVVTGTGQKLILNEDGTSTDVSAQARVPMTTRESTLDLENGQLAFGGSTPRITFNHVVNGSWGEPIKEGLSDAAFLWNVESGKVVNWPDDRFAIMRHRVKHDGEEKTAIVAVNFDGEDV